MLEAETRPSLIDPCGREQQLQTVQDKIYEKLSGNLEETKVVVMGDFNFRLRFDWEAVHSVFTSGRKRQDHDFQNPANFMYRHFDEFHYYMNHHPCPETPTENCTPPLWAKQDIHFFPTYKTLSDATYNPQRIVAWTDRVLTNKNVTVQEYTPLKTRTSPSDHQPVMLVAK